MSETRKRQYNNQPVRRNHRKRRRKKNRSRLILLIVICVLVACGLFLGIRAISKGGGGAVYYLGSDDAQVKLYNYDEYGYMVSNETVKRGTEIRSSGETITYNGIEYTEITLDGKTCYALADFIVPDKDDIVRETVKYVRTPVTVYEAVDSVEIASYFPKSSKLDIISYNQLLDDGSVDMYEVQSEDGRKGWVYGKYLVNTQELADANYNENGEFDIHKERVYDSDKDLGGGDPRNIDWYPYEKPHFEDNPIMENAKAMYLTGEAVSKIDEYLAIADSNGVDTLVCDIKDGNLSYFSEVAEELSPTSYANGYMKVEDYKAAIDKARDKGYYIIGRIVTFNDATWAKDHPEYCIESSASTQNWPSGFNRETWEYNIKLALEGIEWFGFNEIQFDYIRFPEESYRISQAPDSDFKNEYNEDMCTALQNFAFYACDCIHKENVYVSFDVFGECAGKYVTAYGQYWPALSNVIDAISGMPYTDHFGESVDTWSDPYTTLYEWGLKAAARQNEIPTPGIARTWITCYNVPWWNPTVIYDASKMEAQVNGLIDAGLPGGFMTWNGVSKLEKYQEVAPFWNIDYDWYKVADPSISRNSSETTTSGDDLTGETSEDTSEDTTDSETYETDVGDDQFPETAADENVDV